MDARKLDLNSQEWVSPLDGLRFKLLQHAGQRVRLAEFAANFVEPGWCRRGHCDYVLSGRAELEFQDSRLNLEPGDAFVIPQDEGSRHIIHVGPEPIRMILVDEA
jgi:mannose-6-phosphate isomerase-like protein (cupin superfamily)